MMEDFQLTEKMSWHDLGNGIKRQILGYDDTVMMVKVMFEKGAVGTLHHHPHVQTTYIESGVFEFFIDGRSQVLKKGDSCYVASGAIHGCTCIEQGMLIDVFSPSRRDFLEEY